MPHPVFISYARKASRAQAEALHQALGGETGQAFLDSSGIEPGERLPPELVAALLGARVVVVFASKEYFRRWYCLWELEAALGPFLALGSGASDTEKTAAMAPLVVALPVQPGAATGLLPLPPALRTTNWPRADEIPVLEKLVRARLAQIPSTLEERLNSAGRLGAGLRTRLLEESALPAPKNLAAARMHPRSLPPSLGESFVGRADELWRIHYTLSVLRDRRGEGAAGAALTGALHGAGGFGKTRLALEYLHRLGPSDHPGGVFWVNADAEPGNLEEQFHGILRTLRPEVPDLVTFRKSERDSTQEMAEALEAVAATERVLYVVDNVPEPGPKEAQRPLRTWCPALGKVSLLATSRAKLDLGVEGVHALPLSPLTPEAAVVLLTEAIPERRLGEEGWQRIAEWVGYLPLALELLNRALRAGALEPGELLSRAEGRGPAEELDQQMEALRPHVPPGALRGITEAFSLSYAKLSEAEQRAARLIAWLAPDPVPMKLFEALGPEVAVAATRAKLRSRHFVTPVDDTSEVIMFGVMHRVLADCLRGQTRQRLQELRQVCQGLVDVMPLSACEDPREWPLLKACLSHAQNVFDRLLESSKSQGAKASSVGPNDAGEIALGFALGRFLSARGLEGQACKVKLQTVERAREALGEEHPDTLTAMGNLADTFYAQGKIEGAWELEQRVLEVRRRILGEEHPGTLTAMGNLANTLWAQGKLEGARELEQRVLEVRRRILGEEHPGTLTAMGNLANTLWAQGELEEARELEQRVLEVRRRVLGEEHPDTLTAMGNLANTLCAQGELEEARELGQRVLEVRRRVLGEEHPDTLTAMGNLANTLYAQGKLEGARELGQRVLEVMRRVLGEEHPNTLLAMKNLDITLQAIQAKQRWGLKDRVLNFVRRVQGRNPQSR